MNALKTGKYLINIVGDLKKESSNTGNPTKKDNSRVNLEGKENITLPRRQSLSSKKKFERNLIAKKIKDLNYYRLLYKKRSKIFSFFSIFFKIFGVSFFLLFFKSYSFFY